MAKKTTEVKHPEVHVDLSGQDGNAFMIVGRVSRELKKAGVSPEEIEEFRQEAFKGSYDNVIQTAMRWVEVS